MNTAPSVEVKIPNAYHGFVDVKGLLKLRGDDLILELQEKDAVFGMYRSTVEEYRVPLEQLDAVWFKKKWLSALIELKASNLKLFDDVPGSDGARLTLKAGRKNKSEAESLYSVISLRHSEIRLRKFDEDHDS